MYGYILSQTESRAWQRNKAALTIKTKMTIITTILWHNTYIQPIMSNVTYDQTTDTPKLPPANRDLFLFGKFLFPTGVLGKQSIIMNNDLFWWLFGKQSTIMNNDLFRWICLHWKWLNRLFTYQGSPCWQCIYIYGCMTRKGRWLLFRCTRCYSGCLHVRESALAAYGCDCCSDALDVTAAVYILRESAATVVQMH